VQIARHTVASIDYTLTDDDGNVIDSSSGGAPLAYVHGLGALIPGLESQLEGKRKGDALKVRIAPADGYGERDEQMVARVPRTQMPKGAQLELGMQLEARGPDGGQVVTVVKLEDDAVWLDANHPLAGVHLNFAVTVVDVRAASAEEIQHGHVHGPGGHHH
jgi:FKBP-type peptidyl-prolyl cis-trans isomerase SlyD